MFHESLLHECLKSSLAFRKPATAVASRRPGRADGLMVGLDGHASLSAGRAPWRDGQGFLCTECAHHAADGQENAQGGTGSMLRVSADDNIGVTADGEVVVGRRRSHRADVLRPRPQCPGSPPCPWLGPPWSLVP